MKRWYWKARSGGWRSPWIYCWTLKGLNGKSLLQRIFTVLVIFVISSGWADFNHFWKQLLNLSHSCACKHEFLRVSTDLSRFRPVYAPKDFLEVSRHRLCFSSDLTFALLCWFALYIIPHLYTQVLISLRNPNYNSSEDISVRSHWGLIQVPLSVPDIPQLVCVCVHACTHAQRPFGMCAPLSMV